MRVTASSSNISGVRLGFCFFLLAVLLVLLLAVPRSSGALVSAEGFPVATAAENETSAAVSGNTAVWAISRAGGLDIQGKNLSTGADLNLPPEPGAQVRPAVSGRIVVWEDTSSGDSDVYGYDLSTRLKFPVAVGPGDQARPAVSGGFVVWEDNRNGDRDIYGFDVNTGQENPVTTAAGDQRNPVVGGGAVVWEDRDAMDSDVVAKDLAGGAERTVASGPQWQDSPAVGGDAVVWREEHPSGNHDVYGYDLAEERRYEVAVGPSEQYDPAVTGRVVTWVDDPGGNANIRGRDLSTGEVFPVASGSDQQEAPAVSGETAVWEVQLQDDMRLGSFDVLGARLDLAPVAPGGLTATGSASGVALDWATSSEPDLAGYNVYRSGSEGGEYAKLNTSGPISASSFNDPQAPKGVRSFYKITALDTAGSESAAALTNAVAPQESGISLQSNVPVLEIGSAATLTGSLTSGGLPLANKTVILEGRPLGATTFTPLAGGQLTTDATGGFSLVGLRPEKSTDYRARFASDAEEIQSSESALVRVDVKQLVYLNVSATTVKLGRGLNLSGTTFPAKSGKVKLVIKRAGVVVAQRTPDVIGSRFTIGYRPKAPGTYEVSTTLVDYPSTLVMAGSKRFRVVL